MQFFMAMNPPTTTHQTKSVRVVNGKPVFFEKPELRDARLKLAAYLAKHKPPEPPRGAVRLAVKWCWQSSPKHQNGTYRTSKPDTDNLQKLLKDVMTTLGFWRDDAQVACEIVEKFWADTPGIWVSIEVIDE